MQNNFLLPKQMFLLLTISIMGSAVALIDISTASPISYILIAAAALLCLPVYLMLAYINKNETEKDFFELLRSSFGRFWGNAVIFIYLALILFSAALSFSSLITFFSSLALPKTPHAMIIAFSCAFIIYAANKGFKVMAMFCSVFGIFILAAVILAIIAPANQIELSNLSPSSYISFKDISSNFISILQYPFLEMILFMPLIFKMQSKEKSTKVLLFSLLAIGLVFIIISIVSTGILGEHFIKALYFPFYSASGITNVSGYLERVDALIFCAFIAACFIKVSSMVCCLKSGIERFFPSTSNKLLVSLCALAVAAISIVNFLNISALFDFKLIFAYICLPFSLLFPLILFISVFIKKHKKTKG